MKKSIFIIPIILAIAGVVIFTYTQTNFIQIPVAPNQDKIPHATTCDESLWEHVYHPDRLQVIDPCITVSGIIEDFKAEDDGDSHIRLKLDSQYSDLINEVNTAFQHGDIVVEVICQNPISQENAMQACQNYSNKVFVPSLEGTHVKVTGSYVLDKQHGGWAEIHPVTRIEIIG